MDHEPKKSWADIADEEDKLHESKKTIPLDKHIISVDTSKIKSFLLNK